MDLRPGPVTRPYPFRFGSGLEDGPESLAVQWIRRGINVVSEVRKGSCTQET